ncbi:pyridoxamine 5'-phosphate oxidase family protein [Candidatus Methanomethylophilus sp. 1R26]|uniref:pyridoxamine 5'-phosphate oxidase family protein n=1 Tax=Candidatus Methanomethylophilus sp. 1R26 TaxID=1769296 RepID=UPI001F2509A4|nr:hypothetical protein [Candidatus Methanomethylophilus sp. 1R26]
MAMITPKMKALFEDHKKSHKYFALATASKDGVPTSSPSASCGLPMTRRSGSSTTT